MRSSPASSSNINLRARAKRRDERRDRLRQIGLQVAIAARAVRLRQRDDLAPGERREDGEHVGDARLALRVVGDLASAVGDGTANLFGTDGRLIEQVDDPCGRRSRLAHFCRRLLQVADLRRGRDDVRPRHAEGLAEALVEALREIPRELEMLLLVGAHRHELGLVEQDVRRLQHRIGEQADARAIGFLPLRLVLELRHARGLAEAGDAAEDPGELRVLGDVALDEQGAAPRLEARGEELRDREARAPAQLRGVLVHRDGVQIDHTVERVVVALQRDPLAHRAEIVAEVKRISGRLDARQYARAHG